ncbi:class I SAM-dependent methyltransferase [Nocardia sp. NPDC023852]|uniref:class I SAM-dependent methyltransferase n=1 Tax=Nocardia sp. NPDC023852 TaxID=3154697 RepID=UPI00341016A7
MGNSIEHDVAATSLRAERANSFGAHAAAYAEHRPDYPAAAIQWALKPIAHKQAPVVLDLGAGTGKLTEGLLAAGATVIAVEPDAEMRAELVRRLPEVTTYDGAAESIPLPNSSVDAIVAGQAFHWFDQQRAFPELARVLCDGGVFAALWNTDDMRVDWVAGLARVARSDTSSPLPKSGDDELPAHALFQDFEHAEFPHAHRRTAESLAATIGTYSYTLVVSAQQRTDVLGRITDYLRSRPETVEGEFDMPLRTQVIRAGRADLDD